MPSNVWILALLALVVALSFVALLLLRRGQPGQRTTSREDLPESWPLVQRPIFSTEERALFRQLRTALPQHIVLAKVPLVRFSQPQNREELRYWFNLLGPIHVSFVVCAENGRVLAALDIERPDRPSSKRSATIKQAVLEACRVRYVKCRSDQLPSAAELQMLVPQQQEASRPIVPRSLSDAGPPRRTLAHTVRGPQNPTPWYESGFSHDSFFAPESQRDPLFDESIPGVAPGGARPPASNLPAGSTGVWAQGGGGAGGAGRIRRADDFGPSGDTAGHIIGRV